MDQFNPNNQAKYLTLIQTAQKLSVSVDILLQWNDFNILKPTITQRGQIVYSHEQIDKFLEAQQLLLSKKIELEDGASESDTERWTQDQSYFRTSNVVTANNNRATFILRYIAPVKDKIIPVGLAVALSIVVITLFSVIHTGSDKGATVATNVQAPAQKDADTDQNATAQTSKSVFSESTPPSIQTKENGTPQNYNLGLKTKEITNTTLTANSANQTQVLGAKSDQNTQIVSPKLDSIGYSEITKFSGSSSNANNLFDDSGNIKGDAPATDVLGLAMGINKIIHVDNSVKPPTNIDYIFIFIVVVALSILFLFRKFPAYSFQSNTAAASPTGGSTHLHKVFEIDQKTDGTVVLYYKGNEYKVSKPELDSESDQFIEKLMEVSESDIQEIDYDKSSDENIKLSTPLSKLVTRLGFVGTKRELFFPRTSKNKVLFRRYITKEDLQAMNLDAAEISKELIQ